MDRLGAYGDRMEDDRLPPRKRRTRAELRELMIEAGVEVLAEHGVEMQISSVSYAKVFDHLERTRGVRITYGSVHERIWDSVQDYQVSVIERAGLWDSSSSDRLPSAYVLEAMARADEADPADRPRLVQELWRRFAREYIDASEAEDGWSEWLKTVVTMSTQPEGSAMREAARNGVTAVYERMEQLVRENMTAGLAIGFTPGDVFPDDADVPGILARISIALAEGLDLRTALTEQEEPVLRLQTGPNGELEEWNFYGFAMWAIVRAYFDAVTE